MAGLWWLGLIIKGRVDYYTIFDNFWRGFWQEQGDRPNGTKCNLGRFQPRTVTPLVDWDLYRATHTALTLANAIKYIWRADLKNDALEDLEKAIWYLLDEIQKRKLDSV